MRQCRACKVIYVTPRLSESVREAITLRAPGGMDSPRNLMLRHLMAERLQTMHREMYSLEGMARNAATLLEVGSGWGHFLQLCRPHYRSVDGVELSREQADFSRERFDLEVSRTDIFKDPRTDRYNIIAAWELIDHLAYPTRFLQWAHDHLQPGGQLVLSVPNHDSLYRRLLGTHWFHFDPARRLTYFNPSTIKEWLHKAGFTDVAVFTSGRSLLRERFNNHNQIDRGADTRGQWLETLRIRERLDGEREAVALDKSNFVKRAWHASFWRVLNTFAARGMGDQMRIYARRS